MQKERVMLGTDASLANLQLEGKDPNWLHQWKWDGNRGSAEYNNGAIKVVSRNGEDWAPSLPEMVEAIQALAKATGVTTFRIDGEIVCFKDGHSHLPSSNSRVHCKDRQRIKLILRRTLPVTYMVFDVIEWNGRDCTGAAFEIRDHLLDEIFRDKSYPAGEGYNGLQIPGVRKVKTYIDATECWDDAFRHKEEGIMMKHKDSQYVFERSKDWLKIKARDKGTFHVVGYTQGDGNREETFGALILANPTTGAFACRCGGGFTEETAHKIISILEKEPRTGLPFPESEVGRPYTAVDTRMMVEVAFQATDNYSATGKLRSPQLIGWWMQ